MSIHKKLMTACCAAVLALGLAACGSSSDDANGNGGDNGMPPPMAHACDAGASQACVDARQAELEAIEADDDATVGALNAARMAVADAQTALDDANTAAAEEMTVSDLIVDGHGARRRHRVRGGRRRELHSGSSRRGPRGHRCGARLARRDGEPVRRHRDGPTGAHRRHRNQLRADRSGGECGGRDGSGRDQEDGDRGGGRGGSGCRRGSRWHSRRCYPYRRSDGR